MASSSKQSSEKGVKTTLLGIIVSIILVLVKGTAGVLGNSYALVADAIESSTDVITSIIVMFGLRLAAKPADSNHPYGHGKAEPIAGMVVAFALFAAAVIIIIQSIHEIITPHHAPAPFTLIVLVVVVAVKETLFRYIIKVGESMESVAVRNDAWHHRSDAITSGAAFIGISAALIGGEGYEQADDYAALFASGIIIFNAFRLLKPALYEIMDTAPDPEIINRFKATAMSVGGVMGIDRCVVRKMGFDYFVDLHIIVNGNITVHEGHQIAHDVRDTLIEKHSNVNDVLIHVEPDE